MKVSKAEANPQNINFKGIKKAKDECGDEIYKLYLPHDSSKYDVSVEIQKVEKQGNEWKILDKSKPIVKKMVDKSLELDPSDLFHNDKTNFAYRFVLKDKGTDNVVGYESDNGTFAKADNDDSKFTVVLRNRGTHNKPGQMMHVMPDNFNPGFKFNNDGKIIAAKAERERAINATRNHFNQLGGNIAGIAKRIPEMKEMGVSRVLSTPLFGQDELSSHGYWTTNPFQVSTQNGTREDFNKLQVELFKNDMGLVADGAFVNEGLEGAHLKHVLKWGEESPYSNWFRVSGLSSAPLSLGVIPNVPEDSESLKHIKLKVVNAPKTYKFTSDSIETSKNKNYNPAKPTFVQLYDDRLASKKQIESDEIIRRYDNPTPKDNNHEVVKHNDSVLPYAFELNTNQVEQFNQNLKKASTSYDKKDSIGFIKAALHFDEFQVDTKGQGNRIGLWDGNQDVAKLNYRMSKQDSAELEAIGKTKKEQNDFKVGGYQVQSYIQKVGSYWTQETRKALIQHTLHQLKNVNQESANDYVKTIKNSKELPSSAAEVMNKEVVENILDGDYEVAPPLPIVGETPRTNMKHVTVGAMMGFPLDSVEFAPDLTAVLGSPFLSKSAFRKEDLGKEDDFLSDEKIDARVPDEFKKSFKKMNEEVYNSRMYAFAEKVINSFERQSGVKLIKEGPGGHDDLTEVGQHLVPMIASDIARYALVRALAPDSVSINPKKGEINYDIPKMREVGLKKLAPGEKIESPKQEVDIVLDKIQQGFKKFGADEDKTQEDLAAALVKQYEGLSEKNIKIATALIDRTESGLNWRIDATKDVGNIDHIKNGNEKFDIEWDEATDFWKGFADRIKFQNKNSYIIAEMTDLNTLAKNEEGNKYHTDFDAESSFIEKTGITTISNYKYFYSALPGLVANKAENGQGEDISISKLKGEKLQGEGNWPGNNGFLNFLPNDSVKHAHNFFSNHDKPRILHGFALDIAKFHGSPVSDEDAKTFAPKLFEAGKKAEVQPKAVAMAAKVNEELGHSVDELGLNPEVKGKVLGALQDFVQGTYMDKKIDADAFGAKPFDIVIKDSFKQAREKHGLSDDLLSKKDQQKLENKTLEKILKPAMAKYRTILKALVVLPGDSTMYAGDELGETGYETPFKNDYVQNRNVLHWEWLNEPGKEFIKDHYKDVQEITSLRNDPTLSALSNGDTKVLSVSDSDNAMAMYRYDDKSAAICLININKENAEGLKDGSAGEVFIDEQAGEGIKGGLQVGTKFRNISNGAEYKVVEKGGRLVLRNDKDEQVKMNDNVVVLRQASNLNFGNEKSKSNFLKIQAYLNSSMVAAPQKSAV